MLIGIGRQLYLCTMYVYTNLKLDYFAYRSCGTLADELQQLSRQKETHLAEIEKLKAEEKDFKSRLTDLASQVQGQERDTLSGRTLETGAKNSSSPARKDKHINEPAGPGERVQTHVSNGLAPMGRNKAKKPNSHERQSMEDNEGEEDIDVTSGSMDLAELGQTSVQVCVSHTVYKQVNAQQWYVRCYFLFVKVSNGFQVPTAEQLYPSDSEDSSLLLDKLQDRLTTKSRELHRTLVAEQDSLVKTRAYLKEQQETLKRKKEALRHTHNGWNGDMRSSKPRGAMEVRTIALDLINAL